MSTASPTTSPALTRRQLRQIAIITAVAIAIFAFMRWLPTGTNLNHMDFRVDAKNVIDFCDPLNPQFIPVVAVTSPVNLTLSGAQNARAGELVRATAVLRTANGKPIATPDLVVTHTELLHLLIVDPTLTDYQHVHPQPGRAPGEWEFAFTPRFGGTYRVFADFTPAATNRGLYAHVDLPVAGPAHDPVRTLSRPGAHSVPTQAGFEPVTDGDYVFKLSGQTLPIRAGQPADLWLTIERSDGGAVPLEPVMGAFAHLVAFDEASSGFAHLHPGDQDLTKRPDAHRPALDFKITIPRAGRYVIWSQVNLDGREVFTPFWFEVVE